MVNTIETLNALIVLQVDIQLLLLQLPMVLVIHYHVHCVMWALPARQEQVLVLHA
jgi:hypothetical protein